MFDIFRDSVLIGRVALAATDPPMGCASGPFEPGDAFFALMHAMQPVRDGAGKAVEGARMLPQLSVQTSDGRHVECLAASVFEWTFPDAVVREVNCDGIPYPLFEELFPGAHDAYVEGFRKT